MSDLARYVELVGTELPARGRGDGWVLTQDHCFGRVLLDHVTGGCWYDTLDRRSRVPAREQLDVDQLARAVELGERLLVEGEPLLRELDAQSLAWRGKPARRTANRWTASSGT